MTGHRDILLIFRLFFGMGIIWYFEVISFFVAGEWSTVTDIINMLQVSGRLAVFDFDNFDKYPGSLGVPLICLQEECLQHGPQCRLKGPSQSVMKYYVILFGNQ